MPKSPQSKIQRVRQQLDRKHQSYENFIDKTKINYPEVVPPVSIDPTSIQDIQARLSPGSTLVEYYTTKNHTYVWVIKKKRAEVHTIHIGKKQLIKMVNRILSGTPANRSASVKRLITLSTGEFESQPPSTEAKRERRVKAIQQLYQTLVGPFAHRLNTRHLIVVPHGVLHKLPFNQLGNVNQCLIDRYAVSMLPSASVIKHVIQKRNPDNGSLLAFANPISELKPLQFTETEVNDIAAVMQDSEVYVKGEATESIAKQRSSYADVLHFACHGEFSDKQPMQSGLILSKDIHNDGYLQVHEIFDMDLRNANLVVLSACNTALSRIYGGDDLVGMSRGFIYAGAPSILATLWAVDDHSTAILMKNFYVNWREKKMTKAEALRQAQLTLKSIPAYRDATYWAPFVLIGDWQ